MTIWRLLAGEKGRRFLLLSWNHRSPFRLPARHLRRRTGRANGGAALGARSGSPSRGGRHPRHPPPPAPCGWRTPLPDHPSWHTQEPLCRATGGGGGGGGGHPPAGAVRGGTGGGTPPPCCPGRLPPPRQQPQGGRWCRQSPVPGASPGGGGRQPGGRPPRRGAALGKRRISAVPICPGGASSLRAPATMAPRLPPAPCPSGARWHLRGSAVAAQFAREVRLELQKR